ncbi:MAG: hypothetical protein HFJ52_04160 [Clostridia bacterium]|jgi:hypothetical protein|nr:hypothetical protein [Clostridia bacterium]
MKRKNEEYTKNIISSIMNLFHNEEEQEYEHIEFEELGEGENLTQFFIGFLKAGTVIHNRLTSENMNNLDFTQTLTHLCVQDLLQQSNSKLLEESEKKQC